MKLEKPDLIHVNDFLNFLKALFYDDTGIIIKLNINDISDIFQIKNSYKKFSEIVKDYYTDV